MLSELYNFVERWDGSYKVNFIISRRRCIYISFSYPTNEIKFLAKKKFTLRRVSWFKGNNTSTIGSFLEFVDAGWIQYFLSFRFVSFFFGRMNPESLNKLYNVASLHGWTLVKRVRSRVCQRQTSSRRTRNERSLWIEFQRESPRLRENFTNRMDGEKCTAPWARGRGGEGRGKEEKRGKCPLPTGKVSSLLFNENA